MLGALRGPTSRIPTLSYLAGVPGDVTPEIVRELVYGAIFTRGPKDLHELPEYFGRADATPVDLSGFDIQILAEINHARGSATAKS